MHDKSIVNYLHPDKILWWEGHLTLESIDQRRVQFVDKDATKEGISMQHDDLVAEARHHDLVLLPPELCFIGLI